MSAPLKVDLLLQELKNVEWDTLGTYLGLSQSEISEIERDHKRTWRRKIVMLDMWLRKEENPSWAKIIAALEKMSETSLASRLRNKYQQQPNGENLPETTATEIVLSIKHPIARELESFKKSYARLVMSAKSALVTANPSSLQLNMFFQFYMNDRVSTVEELFDCLREFSFLDYHLLETTISMFLMEAQPVVSDLSDYIQQLNNFKKSTTLNEFMETIKNAQKSKDGKVIFRFVGGWLTKTLEDLDKLVQERFQDRSSVLAAHLTIVDDSTYDSCSTMMGE